MPDSFQHFLQQSQTRVNRCLKQTLEQQTAAFGDDDPALVKLQQASLYSIENGGKRLRPALFYACTETLQSPVTNSDLDKIAAAIECIHSYSLVHDDLPSMDDDDLRRGKPTCHIAFDEATAILVGDGLQALAFELITDCENILGDKQIQLVKILARAAGNKGMVGGQMIDLESTDTLITLEQLENMHRLKTGAMIRICAQMAAACSDASHRKASALDDFASNIGLAFQVHDDILDIESDTETLGKQQGADLELNKQTYPALMGLEASKKHRDELITQALNSLKQADIDSSALCGFANFMTRRQF